MDVVSLCCDAWRLSPGFYSTASTTSRLSLIIKSHRGNYSGQHKRNSITVLIWSYQTRDWWAASAAGFTWGVWVSFSQALSSNAPFFSFPDHSNKAGFCMPFRTSHHKGHGDDLRGCWPVSWCVCELQRPVDTAALHRAGAGPPETLETWESSVTPWGPIHHPSSYSTAV